jgi:type I restriction enzyme M protein
MKLCIEDVENALKNKEIHAKDAEEFIESLKQEVFFGVDANEGVACSAKMNMIVAGDGQNNIRHLDALRKDILEKTTHDQLLVPPYIDAKGKKCIDGKAHLILSNPPFGTSESESLAQADINSYAVKSTKGQSLFIQRMIEVVDPECRIVTVIDEGVLNNYGDQELRRHMLTTCRVEWIVALPEETFKPNKINVKSSFIVLQKRTSEDVDLKDHYPIGFVRVGSLGYDGSGEDLRGFELPRLIKELENLKVESLSETDLTKGYSWEAFKIQSSEIFSGTTNRLDFRYWDPSVRILMQNLDNTSGCLIKAINQIQTRRGNSPDAAEYVSEIDGFALVVKAGSNITKTGDVLAAGDYIEEPLFKEYEEQGRILADGDILVASTGDGTLGKCGVFRLHKPDGTRLPAIADGHVTVIRVEQDKIYPEYLCDYIRKGFGASQVGRLYTGSTGLIEITPEDIDRIVCPPFPSIKEQKSLSRGLRDAEREFETESINAALKLKAKESLFAKASVDALTTVTSS